MKILHLSDVHGDLEALTAVKDYALESKPDVTVISGDLLGQCLSVGEAKEMQAMVGNIAGKVQVNGRSISSVSELKQAIEILLERKDGDAQIYRKIERVFDREAEKQYSDIKGVLDKFPETVLTIPGNWDSTQYFEHFGDFDIHKETREVGDVEFSGYGEGNSTPILLPPTKVIGYSEEELFALLAKEMPEVAVTHNPPKFLRDKNSDGDHVGSWAGLAYVRNPDRSSDLLLCGHVHEDAGVMKPDGLETFVVNAGNLGRFRDSPVRGCFVEIDYDKEERTSIEPYRVLDNGEVFKIKDLESEPSVTLTVS